MDGDPRRARARDMLIGGALGVAAALAALRRRHSRGRVTTTGLAAFEEAPCYREALERELAARLRPRS